VCAQLTQGCDRGALPTSAEISLERMANEAEKITGFIGGAIYDKLRAYCARLADQPVRGRTPGAPGRRCRGSQGALCGNRGRAQAYRADRHRRSGRRRGPAQGVLDPEAEVAARRCRGLPNCGGACHTPGQVTIAGILDVLWRDYVALAPQAEDIWRLLASRGEISRHDHVAFCTFGAPGIGADAVARPFEALGWRRRERCEGFGRGVRARCWQHPEAAIPRVLIGEVAIEALSPAAQAVIGALIAQLPARFGERGDLPWAGRPWRVAYADYRVLRAESETAAWLAAFGFRVHHFTIDAGALATFPDLAALGAFLVEHGFPIDDRGGEIVGSADERDERIERSATRPDPVVVELADATVQIASSGYEFVRRHRLPGAERFHGATSASTGAVAPSADPGPG
jgi:hypothetical protein